MGQSWPRGQLWPTGAVGDSVVEGWCTYLACVEAAARHETHLDKHVSWGSRRGATGRSVGRDEEGFKGGQELRMLSQNSGALPRPRPWHMNPHVRFPDLHDTCLHRSSAAKGAPITKPRPVITRTDARHSLLQPPPCTLHAARATARAL